MTSNTQKQRNDHLPPKSSQMLLLRIYLSLSTDLPKTGANQVRLFLLLWLNIVGVILSFNIKKKLSSEIQTVVISVVAFIIFKKKIELMSILLFVCPIVSFI